MQRTIRITDITEYEHRSAGALPAEDRPVFHLSPPVGWMNDPNGFSWYGDRYHLFYQYYPFDIIWGPVSWGHAVSRDLLHWEQLPPALAPDQSYDCGGCFSGTAIELAADEAKGILRNPEENPEETPEENPGGNPEKTPKENPGSLQMLMYTGFLPGPEDPPYRGRQSQCLAFGDGLTYEKYEANPVITEEDLPEGGDPYEFRDPKLYRTEDGNFHVLVANHNTRLGAQILQYQSPDGFHWSFERVLVSNRIREAKVEQADEKAAPDEERWLDRLGWMWECPDYFHLDGREILIASAMDVSAEAANAAEALAAQEVKETPDEQEAQAASAEQEAQETLRETGWPPSGRYAGGKTCFCMIGTEEGDGSFHEIAHHPMDQGFDFYAGQTVLSPEGRRILIGWMQNPDTAERRGVSFPINGQMSLPRELRLQGRHILQWPVSELEKLREEPVIYRDLRLTGKSGKSFNGESGTSGTSLNAEESAEKEIRLDGIRGRVMDMEISIRPAAGEGYRMFGIRFAAGEGDSSAESGRLYTELKYEPEGSRLTLDRSHAGPGSGGLTKRQVKVRERGGKLDLRLVMDRLSAEVFINNGEQVMSAVIYTGRTAEDISFFIDGVAMVDIAKYRIKEK